MPCVCINIQSTVVLDCETVGYNKGHLKYVATFPFFKSNLELLIMSDVVLFFFFLNNKKHVGAIS